jgi:hypothetical protein
MHWEIVVCIHFVFFIHNKKQVLRLCHSFRLLFIWHILYQDKGNGQPKITLITLEFTYL